MAKNRNKKNKAKNGGGPAAMDTSESGPAAPPLRKLPNRWILAREAAVFSIGGAQFDQQFISIVRFDVLMTIVMSSASFSLTVLANIFMYALRDYLRICVRDMKIKKGVQIKRSKNVRKMKAVARAISKNEQSEEKVQKAKSKKTRIQSAKSLYD
ncbi:hypothetical protein EJB05_11780 [Eragrostis curvula]|uniref:Uncharacterized protein n=1 Tax=Eragrostis curvula TaxID=38414 RepID=A0A5J9VPV5_9POAL|nr:hypothetical protein EJB05_11780 [Eragrostis curvula]